MSKSVAVVLKVNLLAIKTLLIYSRIKF